MKKRPISFAGPMVRAILDGRKTQTRRLVKPQPPNHFEAPHRLNDGRWVATDNQPPDILRNYPLQNPYGQPGDRLWVREAWRTGRSADGIPGSDLEGKGWPVFYEADCAINWTGATTGGPGFTTPGRYRHDRFMPRWASRITLEITDVRVERLQEISEQDARAEGVDDLTSPAALAAGWCVKPRRAFRRIWESIHGSDSWDSNPWVWAITFERVEP